MVTNLHGHDLVPRDILDLDSASRIPIFLDPDAPETASNQGLNLLQAIDEDQSAYPHRGGCDTLALSARRLWT